MPSLEKIVYFSVSGLLSIIAVALLGYGMSEAWINSTLQCAPLAGPSSNGSATLTMGLFTGRERKLSCPRFDTEYTVFEVFAMLKDTTGSALGLHSMVVILLAFAVVSSACSTFISLYNVISNPYETYLGPIGLYASSGLSACLALLAILLYLVNVFEIKIAKAILLVNFEAVLSEQTIIFKVGFYMIVPYIILNLIAILMVFLYANAAYNQRQEQQKPTEDAPKEILMY